MAEPSLEDFRNEFLEDNYQSLRYIFEEYGMWCIENTQKRTGCDEGEAHDAFMDALVIFKDKVISGELEYLASIRNFLYTICVNTQMERKRQSIRKFGKTEDVREYLYDDIVDDPFEDEVGELIEDHTLLQRCFETLEELGEKCKKILQLFYVEELSISEIAQRLKLANNNVAKSSKSRCFKKWKEEILKLGLERNPL